MHPLTVNTAVSARHIRALQTSDGCASKAPPLPHEYVFDPEAGASPGAHWTVHDWNWGSVPPSVQVAPAYVGTAVASGSRQAARGSDGVSVGGWHTLTPKCGGALQKAHRAEYS
jgi:hypothetical protein